MNRPVFVLFRKMALFIFFISCTQAVLWQVLPLDQDHYFASIQDKQQRLAQTASPKIVLVGGSNLACGVDTKRLQTALGRPVVNMGLHADIGLAYMLTEVENRLQAGDLVVLVPEYEQFFGALYGNMSLIKVVSYEPQGWHYIRSWGQWSVFLLQGWLYLQGKLKYNLEQWFHVPQDRHYEIYHRNGFDAYGDMVTHLDLPPGNLHEATIKPLILDKYDNRAIETINRFYRQCHRRGVKVCLLHPCYYENMLKKNSAAISRLQKEFKNLALPVLSTPEEYAFPEGCFFDTEYHLNRQGRTLRTERLIGDLREILH
jgi:hypothetical protein